jgi:hypothetical protein
MRTSLRFVALFGASFAALLAGTLALAPGAAAQPHDERRDEPRRGFERRDVHEPYRTPHFQFDDRFHHDHFYPALGYSVGVLPPGNLALGFRGGRYFFHGGVWYQPVGAGFAVVRPPFGIVVPVLPPAYATVWAGGVPYYYANDIYYASAPGGYAVVPPPPDPTVAPPPVAAAPAPLQASRAQTQVIPGPAGNWYYCDSAKSYYPNVSQCPEGWRAVPATPPQPR